MTQCHLIGIGGSGAKSVEAALHLFAAGLGPKQVSIRFIDADVSNGNLDRANETRRHYDDARQRLRDQNRGALSASCRLFRTELLPPDAGSLWSPIPPGNRKTLRDLFNRNLMSPDSRVLFDSLFQAEGNGLVPNEQTMPLTEGFRGRPSVGAAITHAMAQEQNSTWSALLKAIEDSKSEDVRIFLVGSVFGGTGAAGFPVIARLLRHALEEEGIHRGVEIAGAMLLPYFRFPESRDPHSIGIAAKPDTFIEQSRGALDYYYNLQKDERVFDNLYMIGWPQLISLPIPATGGKRQNNPPLMPELYAALAAARFFQNGAIVSHSIFHTACREESGGITRLNFNDLPAIDEKNADLSVKSSISQLIRFSVAFRNIYGPLLNPECESEIGNQEWYYRLIKKSNVNVANDFFKATVEHTTKYSDDFLHWIANLQKSSQIDNLEIDLLDLSVFSKGEIDERSQIRLPDQEEWGSTGRRGFGTMIRGSHGTSLATLFAALTEAPLPAATGNARFFEMLFDHCALEPPIKRLVRR